MERTACALLALSLPKALTLTARCTIASLTQWTTLVPSSRLGSSWNFLQLKPIKINWPKASSNLLWTEPKVKWPVVAQRTWSKSIVIGYDFDRKRCIPLRSMIVRRMLVWRIQNWCLNYRKELVGEQRAPCKYTCLPKVKQPSGGTLSWQYPFNRSKQARCRTASCLARASRRIRSRASQLFGPRRRTGLTRLLRSAMTTMKTSAAHWFNTKGYYRSSR